MLNEAQLEYVVTRLRQLIPSSIKVHGGSLDPSGGPLFAEELAVIAHAVPKRRREFQAGRIYARRALRELMAPDIPLLPGKLRSPVWPEGTTGSITHCEEVCAAVAARTADYASLGIDIEDFTSAPSNLVSFVTSPTEILLQAEIERAHQVQLAHLMFAIKEAIYKAYSSLTGAFLDYQDVEVIVPTGENSFCAKLIRKDQRLILGRDEIRGRFAVEVGHVLAFAAVPATSRLLLNSASNKRL